MILIGVYLIYFSLKNKDESFLKHIIIYSLLVILIFILFLFLTGIEINDFFIQYISFPLSIGSERSGLFKMQSFLSSLVNEFKFLSFLIFIIFLQNINLKKKMKLQKKKYFQQIFLSM